jgi:hypothetical protein
MKYFLRVWCYRVFLCCFYAREQPLTIQAKKGPRMAGQFFGLNVVQ